MYIYIFDYLKTCFIVSLYYFKILTLLVSVNIRKAKQCMCVCAWVSVGKGVCLAHWRMFSSLPTVLPSITPTAHTLKLRLPASGWADPSV